jgi:alcohol dehydrogenase class IV
MDLHRRNRCRFRHTKLTRLAAWLGLPKPGYQAVLDWVLALRREIGIPHTLKDIGVGSDRLDLLSEMGHLSDGRYRDAH